MACLTFLFDVAVCSRRRQCWRREIRVERFLWFDRSRLVIQFSFIICLPRLSDTSLCKHPMVSNVVQRPQRRENFVGHPRTETQVAAFGKSRESGQIWLMVRLRWGGRTCEEDRGATTPRSVIGPGLRFGPSWVDRAEPGEPCFGPSDLCIYIFGGRRLLLGA